MRVAGIGFAKQASIHRKVAFIKESRIIVMKLYIKQKVFSIKRRSSIYDAAGNEAYYSEAIIPSIGTKLKIYDRSGAELIYIEQKFWSFLPKYKIFKDGAEIAEVVKDFTFFKPKYTINGLGWTVTGDFFDHNYQIMHDDEVIASVHKEWFTFGDAYELDFSEFVDVPTALAVVLVIDACLDATGDDSGFSIRIGSNR